MATSTAFAPLPVPVLDDSMELTSSPGVSHADNDIDLDLDDYGGVQLTDDEHMMEDSQPTRPGTANDDMMEDAEQMAGTPIVEEVMHDDPVNVTTYDHDEELIDYSDDEYQEDIPIADEADATQHTDNSFVAPTEAVTEPEAESVDEEIVRNPEDDVHEEQDAVPSLLSDTVPAAGGIEAPQQQGLQSDGTLGVNDVPADEVPAPDTARLEQTTTLVSDPADLSGTTATAEPDHEEEAPSADEQQHDGSHADETTSKLPGALDTSAHFTPDGPPTPSDTGMHPMTVTYKGFEMPLFKSRSQPTGLLKDDNLASLSLSNLMANCRQRLEYKIGESISADQDLVLSVQNMGLIVGENSPYAFQTSLSEILEVYIQLHQNDGTSTIPPLALSLSLQLKFSSSFNLFKVAAQQGQGMSSFSFLQQNEDDIESYYEEQAEDYGEEEEDQYAVTGENDQYEGETAPEDFGQEEASQDHEGQEYEEEHEAQYKDDNDHEGQAWDEQQVEAQPATLNEEPNADEDDDHEEASYESYEEHDQQDFADTNNNFSGTESTTHDQGAEPPADLNVQTAGIAANADATDTQIEQEAVEFNEPESAASSATIRDGATNDATEQHADDGEDEAEAHTGGLEEAEEAAAAAIVSTNYDQQTDDTVGAPAGDEYTFDFGAQQEELIDYPEDDEDDHPHATDHFAEYDDAAADNTDQPREDVADEQGQPAGVTEVAVGHDPERGPANGANTKQTVADTIDFDEDRIDFDEDDEDVVQPQAVASASTSNSPLGKRSFDEHDNGSGSSVQPDPKKARAG
ncbi:unnamed protein product [Zymoseptoria tritici ST99CH_3D7]|uniref:Uncharacterized protein n=1 Tax=Zymoseptoria tritici (strain ST99CH_3D7) TaxID=1276538 RepID=A0A1X7RJF4_ZYMT9|nr:unnamed protein product [Zymoseptoria tritici ST99CH_3D7]